MIFRDPPDVEWCVKSQASEGIDQLNPVLVHHTVNTPGWPTLRSLQLEAIAPILNGFDALLLAPTAGGRTEAAVLPLLSAM